MASNRNKEVKKLIKELGINGCTTKITKSGHCQVKIPNGGITVISMSPSDGRWMRNVYQDLRREGFDVNLLK